MKRSAVETGAEAKRARPEAGDAELAEWTSALELSEEMVPVLGKLYRRNNVVCTCFGRSLMNQGAIGILREHDFARQQHSGSDVARRLSIAKTHALLVALAALDVGACRIDLGKMAADFYGADGEPSDPTHATERAFLEVQLESVLGSNRAPLLRDGPQDVVLFGFGRIGRLLARILIGKTGGGDKLRLRAIVVRPTKGGPGSDLEKRATLLRIDSVHGGFDGTISTDAARNALICNGNVVQLLYAKAPDAIDYTSHGIDNAIVIDNTGVFRDRAALSLHLAAKGVGC